MRTRSLDFTGCLTLALCLASAARGQIGGFAAGSRELFSIDFSKTPVGEFPKEIRLIKGKAQVVEKDGAHMLRATEPTDLLVNLAENLPDAFTLEFDLIPKACCNPSDLMFEGTPAMSRSPSSSNVEWHPQTIIVVGGGEYFQTPMPQELAEVLPSVMTHVNVAFDASGMKLFTNDRLITTLAGRKFAHGRVLRVSLGGQDDNLHAVYLGRLRLGAGGAPPGPIAGNTGPTPQISSNTSGASSTGGSVTSSTSMQAGTPRPGLTVTVTMGSAGPVVSWTAVPDATGYAVSRYKTDDVTCCNSSSGRGYIIGSTWQDAPLPMSGTYNYLVLAQTAAGQVRGETQFGYRLPAATTTTTTTTTPTTAVAAVPATTTGTITPMTGSTTTGGTGTSTRPTTTGTRVGTAPTGAQPTVTVMPTSPTSSTSTSSGPGAPMDVARYRVTLTGFRVSKATSEAKLAPDGVYDEAYAAAAVILYDRKTSTVRARSDVRTREYGDIANGTIYGNRIKAGSGSPTGGIWAGNGNEQVPAEFDPSGSSIPAPTTDRFPLTVWEGPLTSAVEALLVVPTIWDRDIDPSPYGIWKQNWSTSPLLTFFSNPLVASEMLDTRLTVTTPVLTVGTPFALAPQDFAAHFKDRPIGVFAEPPTLPVVVGYHDRHLMITAEKLAGIAPGGFTTIAVPFAEPATPITGAIYTLYVRIDRIQ